MVAALDLGRCERSADLNTREICQAHHVVEKWRETAVSCSEVLLREIPAAAVLSARTLLDVLSGGGDPASQIIPAERCGLSWDTYHIDYPPAFRVSRWHRHLWDRYVEMWNYVSWPHAPWPQWLAA